MANWMKSKNWLLTICSLFALTLVCAAQKEEFDIEKHIFSDTVKPIPVSMTGFSGEVDKVLRFDLEIAGFTFASDKPQYAISGSNNGNVQGRLVDALNPAKSLFSKSYAGGTPRSQAHALANDIIFAITQKKGIAGTKVAYRVDTGKYKSEVYVADYDGHNAVAVTSDNSEVSMPTWVPGRSHIFYTSRKYGPVQIMSHNLATGARSVFARYPNSNYSPAVSPDGKRVAMILTKGGSPDLYVADLDGTNLKQLTKTREDESSPCWSPDSSTICFVGRTSGKRAGLFTVSADGGEPRYLSTSGVSTVTEPDWSPDGKQIVFTRQAGGFEICVVPAKGGTAKVLVQGEDPSWAPNSRTVIFTRRINTNKRVLSLLDVPTKRVKDVAQISGSCSQPSWSR